MEKILIDLREENETIRGCFKEEIVSLDKILDVLDEKASEVEELKLTIKELSKTEEEKYEDHLCELADNYNDEVKMGLR